LIIGVSKKNLTEDLNPPMGQVYIYYGNANGIQSSNVSEANVTINGTKGSYFGSAIEAKDLNNDSLIDLVISSPYKNLSDGASDYTGQVHIFYNSQSGFYNMVSTDANVTINGTSPGHLGFYRSGLIAEDFNNDSLLDLVVSAYGINLSGGAEDYTGQVYIFYASSDGFYPYTTAQANETINGSSPGRFGKVLISGDFNNDSLNDLAITAPYKNLSNGATDNTGQVNIFYSNANGLWSGTSEQANITINGSAKNNFFGFNAVSGDMNEDNIDDLAVSAIGITVDAIYAGQVYLYYSLFNGSTTYVSTTFANVTFNGSSQQQFGWEINLEDLNRDNNQDLIIASNLKNLSGGGGDWTGQVSIFYGTSNGFTGKYSDQSEININGSYKNNGFGYEFITGDFNADGIKELVVSAPYLNVSNPGSGSVSNLHWEGQVLIYAFNFRPNNHTAIPDQSWNEDASITLNLSAYFNDTNNDELNYTWTSVSDISVSINEATNLVTLTPTTDWYGTRTIAFYANDSYNALRSSNNITLTVSNTADCGDNTCELNETCSTCQADCGFCYSGGSSSSSPQATHTIAQVQANEQVEFNLNNVVVSKVKIKSNKELSNVKVQVKEKESVSNEFSNKVYKYFEINAYQVTDDDIAEAEIEFDVDKTWLEENEIEAANILLLRYKDTWTELETSLVSEDDDKYYFKAKTSGFSDFAISFKEEEVIEEVQEETEEVEEVVQEVVEPVIEEKSYDLWYVFGIILLLGIIGLFVFLILRKKE